MGTLTTTELMTRMRIATSTKTCLMWWQTWSMWTLTRTWTECSWVLCVCVCFVLCLFLVVSVVLVWSLAHHTGPSLSLIPSHGHRHVSCGRWVTSSSTSQSNFLTSSSLPSTCSSYCLSLSSSLMSWITITRTAAKEIGHLDKNSFSTLTVMDKVVAWVWDGVAICRIFVDVYKRSIVRSKHVTKNGDRPGWKTKAWRRSGLENARHNESLNWVCEDLFKEEHEWVTQMTISESEGLILADLCCNLDVPCVMQWAFWWCTAPSRSNLFHEECGTSDDMFHKVTSTAIQWACGQPYGVISLFDGQWWQWWMTVVGTLDEKHWRTDQELEGWEPRDAGVALNDAGDGFADEWIWTEAASLSRDTMPGPNAEVFLSGFLLSFCSWWNCNIVSCYQEAENIISYEPCSWDSSRFRILQVCYRWWVRMVHLTVWEGICHQRLRFEVWAMTCEWSW